MDIEEWKENLRESATTFVQADDALKKAGKELNPVRKTLKQHRDQVLALLTSQNQKFCDLSEFGARLKVATRKGKKAPPKDTVLERCMQWEVRRGKSDKSGQDLYDFLFRKEVVESETLRRVKIPERERAGPPGVSDEADEDGDAEADEDDEDEFEET